MVGQWEEDNMNQGRHCALSPRIPLSCFNYFMLLNKLLCAGESAYSRSYFLLLWRLTIPRWRCCRFSVGWGLSFCVKTVLLCPPPHGRRGSLFSHISFYKVTIVISTWNIASPTKKKTHWRWIPQMMALLRGDRAWRCWHPCVFARIRKRWGLIGGTGSLKTGTSLNGISCSEALQV